MAIKNRVNLYPIIILVSVVLSVNMNACTFIESNKNSTDTFSDNTVISSTHYKSSNAELTLSDRWVELGEVSGDTLVTAKYSFTNSGDETLKIKSVNPDCIFKSYFLSSEMITPGDSAYIVLELETNNLGVYQGHFRSYATVETNTKNKFYNVVLEGFIEG